MPSWRELRIELTISFIKQGREIFSSLNLILLFWIDSNRQYFSRKFEFKIVLRFMLKNNTFTLYLKLILYFW